MEATIKGLEVVEASSKVKFCPQCWKPGSAADPTYSTFHLN
ncbi:MAG: hypothetical protein ACYTX0_33745 [Nostoc sp.]